ncbi:hypothetical protein TNCV_2663381 [Trichonephila clavipes]|nr:hypothetical protein TNCV_2663381 [Trichonephila clavipes]
MARPPGIAARCTSYCVLERVVSCTMVHQHIFRSTVLQFPEFLLLGKLKLLAYESQEITVEDLMAQIIIASVDIVSHKTVVSDGRTRL